MPHPSDVKIKCMRVSLVLKGADLKRHKDIYDSLRPSITLEGPSGRTKKIVMKNWRVESAQNGRHTRYFFDLKRIVQNLSGASSRDPAVEMVAKSLWKKIKAEIYATSRRKSIVKRYEAAYRKQMRGFLLEEIEKNLTALSKKSVAKYIRPKDLSDMWKKLQNDRMVEGIMSM